MIDDDDEPVTPILCPLCGGASLSEGCRVCGGLGRVTAETRARWKSQKASRTTSTTVAVADIAASVVDSLRVRGTAPAMELAAEGQLMLDVLMSWRLVEVDVPTRVEMYNRVGEWQRRAVEFLGKPKR